MRLGLSLAIFLAWSGAAASEDVRARQIREELERELEAMVKTPPPSLELFFEGLASSRYELLEASFALDGEPLPSRPGQPGQPLYFGVLSPGQHTLTAQLVYREKPSGAVFDYASLKYKLPGRYSIQAQRGLHMRVRIKVEANDTAEVTKRLQIVANLEADMLVEVTESVAESAPGQGRDAGQPAVAPEPVLAQGAPDASTPEPAQAERPKRKRIRRHLRRLLQNLARSTREEAVAPPDDKSGGWTEVEEVEEVPAEKPTAASSGAAPVAGASPAAGALPAAGAPPAASASGSAGSGSTVSGTRKGKKRTKQSKGTKQRTGAKGTKTRTVRGPSP